MKKLWCCLALLFCFSGISMAEKVDNSTIAPPKAHPGVLKAIPKGMDAPDLELKDLKSNMVSLHQSFRGKGTDKITLLLFTDPVVTENMTADKQTSPPSRPVLADRPKRVSELMNNNAVSFYKQLPAKYSNVKLILISTSGKEKTEEFVKDKGISGEVLLDEDKTAQTVYGITKTPTIMLITGKKKIVATYRGFISRTPADIESDMALLLSREVDKQ